MRLRRLRQVRQNRGGKSSSSRQAAPPIPPPGASPRRHPRDNHAGSGIVAINSCSKRGGFKHQWISSARGLNTIDEGDDRFASYVMARVSLGPLRLHKLIRSRRSQLAGSTAARGGRDLPLPKPTKGATLCPQLPGILGSRWNSIGARIVLRDANVIADTGTSATFVKCRIPRSNYLGVREGTR